MMLGKMSRDCVGNVMNDERNRQLGLTLFEMLLAMVIGAGILLISINQYKSFQIDSDVQKLKYNVDRLFQAAAQYNYANCSVVGSPLYPGATSPVVRTITQLQTDGFLDIPPSASAGTPPFPDNQIVDNSGGSASGYVVQYNLIPIVQRVSNTVTGPGPTGSTTGTMTYSSGGGGNTGSIYSWKIQVAVKIRDAAKYTLYKNLLAADCLSNRIGGAGTSVKACDNTPAPTAGNTYLVWERLPSRASPDLTSELWVSNPAVIQFQQMYTTYPITYVLSGGPSSQYGSNGSTAGTDSIYLLCGS